MTAGIKFNRVWAMPTRWTFTIKPIAELLSRYVGDGSGWVDPFAGFNSPAQITNDLNPESPATFHMYAHEFCRILPDNHCNGILFDPPYNLSQIKECYNNIGSGFPDNWNLDASFGEVKTIASPKIKEGGYAISFGWNSNGFGKKRGFALIEILMVPHGGHHYDTIATVERKVSLG